MSLFQSNYALVSQYVEATFTQINAGTLAVPTFLMKTTRNSHLAYILNETDSEIAILAVAPTGSVLDPAQVKLFLKVGAGGSVNFDSYFQEIEPGVEFYTYCTGTNPATANKLRMLIWS